MMRKSIVLIFLLFLIFSKSITAQTVIITDDSTYTNGAASAVLELNSSSKGFLGPKLTNSQKKAIASPASGLMIYQTDSIPGYYIFNNGKWEHLESKVGSVSVVNKTTNASISKSETFVAASNNITLSLPVISAEDDGLAITVKNIGTYTDLVLVAPNGSATIDGQASSTKLTRWQSKIFQAYNGNWLVKNKDLSSRENILEVAPSSSWTSVEEAVEFLNMHMTAPTMIRLSAGDYPISNTININLPFPLTLAGINYGAVNLNAASGLSGKPMFNCSTETYFRMLLFNAGTLSGYGNAVHEDGIVFNENPKKYYDINECKFDGFNKSIILKNNSELWVFNCYILNSKAVGVEIAAGALSGVVFRVAETKMSNNPISVNLASGVGATISIRNGGAYATNSTDVIVNYDPANFTSMKAVTVMNMYWNGTGKFINGFDFTRADGRDAAAYIQLNVNEMDHNPSSMISVSNNTLVTNLTLANTYYKANWVNTDSTNSLMGLNGNRVTYLSTHPKDLVVYITGNLFNNSRKSNITIGLVKNGNTSVVYGATSLYVPTITDPFQFGTVIYLKNVSKNDYFELYCKSDGAGDAIVFKDVQWLTESK